MEGIFDSVSSAIRFVIDGAVALWYAYRAYIIPVASGFAAVYATFRLTQRIEDRERRRVGPVAAFAAGSFLVLIVSSSVVVQFTPSAPYQIALVPLFVAAAVWAFFRVIQKERKERKKELTQLISSPALVSWTVFVVLLSVLWIISLGIDALGASTNAKPEAGLAWFLTQLTAVGVLSMATIQGIRSVLPIRGVFHRASLERWIDESIKRRSTAKPEDKGSAQTKEDEKSNEESAKKSPSDSTPNQQLMKRIVELSTVSTGDGYAFFDLPLEQLCGQIAAGADRLLDDPLGHMPGDMETKDHPDDRRAVKSLLSVLAGDPSDVDTFVSDAQIVGKDENATRDFLRTRANLSQRIQRNIDRLQIDTSFWWKRLVRGLAFTLCAVFGLAVFKNAIAAVICAVVAGFIAMVARDLVAIVEKARR